LPARQWLRWPWPQVEKVTDYAHLYPILATPAVINEKLVCAGVYSEAEVTTWLAMRDGGSVAGAQTLKSPAISKRLSTLTAT
jgi:hypothetical protein